MTTIVYSDGIIAYDSRACMDNRIISDNYNKMMVFGKVRFWICGSTCEAQNFIAGYFGEDFDDSLDICALVWDNGNLFYSGYHGEKKMWRDLLDMKSPFTLGTGGDHAITAIDCGKTAIEAVKFSAKRDVNTGGRIRSYKL